VALVEGTADPEIDIVETYLFYDLNLGPHLFEQQMLVPESLLSYRLVVWDGLGGTNTLAANTVDAIYAAYTNRVPVYLIGEYLAGAGAALPEPQRTEWRSMTRLSAPTGVGGDGMVVICATNNPIANGVFGAAGGFGYAAPVDLATNVDPAAEVIGTNGPADVLVAYPGFQNDAGQTRTFTQELRVCLPDEPGSTNVLRDLFDNTVVWLLNAQWCDDVDMFMVVSNAPGSVRVGQLLTLEVEVNPAISECPVLDAAVTNQLSTNFQLFSAQGWRRPPAYDPMSLTVMFPLGYLDSSSPNIPLTLTVMPVRVGFVTNVFGFLLRDQGNEPENAAVTNIIQVLPGPDLTPKLGIGLVSPSQYELHMSGVSNVLYEVQSSPDLKNWTTVTNALGPQWSMTSGPANGTKLSFFYRAGTAP